jgi:NADH:ubiquinone oxidoreductase subunit F (NADH-binding)
MSSAQSTYADPPTRTAQPPVGLPRLLAGMPAHGSLNLAEHHCLHGPLPETTRHRRRRSELIAEIEQAGLRGRGGANFPTAQKLAAVAGSRGRPIVVINAAEGEPASRKDATLTRALPHLVLDGGELAAQALGSSELIVGVRESAITSFESLATAIAERTTSARRSLRIRLTGVPDRYVAGQETALIAHLGGASALPTFTPPLPFQHGVARRPTLVSNAETFAHIALIARHGARWFRELGTSAQPGSAFVTLSGPVAYPGVYEVECGAPLGSLIDAAGGLSTPARALLLGGYGGSWVAAEHLDCLCFSEEQLAPYGASPGAGVVVVLSENACPVAETARLARWLAGESAGQCGPCLHGLEALATSLQMIAGQDAHAPTRERIERLLALVRRRGACAHPDGAARLIQSAIDTFEGEFAEHARYGTCERCVAPPELPLMEPKRRRHLSTRRSNLSPARRP